MGKKGIIFLLVIVSIAIMAFDSFSKSENSENSTNSGVDTTFEPIVVLELFTSQGCSSCPAADLLLKKVKREGGNHIFTLSYHVDYWNYIGWEDPFSKPQYAEKQRLYNKKFRNRSNYTPQVVVNGNEHFVGSNSSKMSSIITKYQSKKTTNKLGLSNILREGNSVSFDYEIQGDLKDKSLRTILVLDERTTEVKRGENRNRTLINSNIVVAQKISGLDSGTGKLKITIPKNVDQQEDLELIVIVENIQYDITAAAKGRLQ